MRKESLKKNSTNGVVEDSTIVENNDADLNGSSADADPLVKALWLYCVLTFSRSMQFQLGADQPALDLPKKKGRKKNETVTEVAVPLINNDGNEDYEVEDIIDHKFEKKVRLFLVRWKNCAPDDDTWEPESSLACPDIVKKYLENNPEAEQAPGSSRKRPASKDKPSTTSVVPAKRSRSKVAKSTASDNQNNDDKENGEEEYEVEEIVDHKVVRGKTSFLIRWKNYDASGDTWEPESSLSCPEIIAAYKANLTDVDFKPNKGSKQKPKKDKSEKEYEVQVKSEYVEFFFNLMSKLFRFSQMIIDEKVKDGVKHYLVRWRGYRMDDDTWEPENSLNCPDLISKFQEQKKNKRTGGVRGTPKKLTYTEVDETEGEDVKNIYVNGSKAKTKSKSKSNPKSKGTKAKPVGRATTQKEEDYEVEEIVGEKMEKGKKYYFLKWKGKTRLKQKFVLFEPQIKYEKT